jgi:hypothetical protein
VCGNDGQTYNAVCGRECVTVGIACEGECPCESCGELEQVYAEAVAQGKSCTGGLTCDILVPDSLACPCNTYIAYGEVLNVLDPVRADWDANDCGANIECPAIACAEPTGASCEAQPGSTEAICVDEF